jgi:hypothetical protein
MVPKKFALMVMKMVVQLPEGVAAIPFKVPASVAAEQSHHDDLGFAGKKDMTQDAGHPASVLMVVVHCRAGRVAPQRAVPQ